MRLIVCLFAGLVGLVGTVNSGAWGPKSRFSPSNEGSAAPEVAMSADGRRAIAVWDTRSSSTYTTCASSYSGNCWGRTTTFSQSSDEGSSPQVAMSADGRYGVAIWKIRNGSTYTINSAVYSYNKWIPTVAIASSTTGELALPQVAMSANGKRAIAIWEVRTDTDCTAFTATWSDGEWNTPSQFLPASNGGSVSPQIAMDTDGTHAVAVWESRNDTARTVYASICLWGIWGTPSRFSPVNGRDEPTSPQVAMSADGLHAVAAWETCTDSNYCSYVALCSGETWGTAFALSPSSNTQPTFPQVAMNGDGKRAIASWRAFDGSSFTDYAAIYSSGAWGSVSPVSKNSKNLIQSKVAISRDGMRAIVAWRAFDGSIFTDYASMYSGGGWGTQNPFSRTEGKEICPQVTMSADGNNAVVTWQALEKEAYVDYSSVYSPFAVPNPPDPTDLTPPVSAKGKRLFQHGVYCDKLTWRPSASPNATKYQIYRGNKKIKTVKSKILKYITGPVKSEKKYSYKILSADNAGHKSAPTSVKVKKSHSI